MNNRPIAVLIALLIYLLGAAVVMLILVFPVLMLAGPHSDLLAPFAQKIVLGAAWILVVFAPLSISIRCYRRIRDRL